jgi:replication factor A1
VATLLLGDETGTTRVVLWDEKAGAALDVEAGEVLEVIGRHPGKNTREIYALALRKVSIEIAGPAQNNANGSLSNEPVDLDVFLVFRGEPRSYTRRDGTTGEMVEALIADAAGTARLVAWAPELLLPVSPGSCVHITGAKPNQRDEGRSYSLDEKSTVIPTDLTISIPFTSPGSVGDQGIYSVTGEVKQVQQPRSFTTRNGNSSWVKNIVITDGNDDLNVVLWGDHALVPLTTGDTIEVFHATAKPGRFGNIELAAGRGSVVRVPNEETRPIVFSGTIIPGPGCTFIDNGSERYLIDADFPAGTELQVSGTVQGCRILPEEMVPVAITPETVTAHIASLKKALDK